jgi:putative hemolysin
MLIVTLEIIFILILMLANGLFAMSEIAVVSARKVRLEQWANDGDLRAGVALELANSPTRFLSTVQIGITLISTLAGALGGATVSEELARHLAKVSALAPYSHAISLAIVVLAITFFSLVVGELVPKRLALNNPERIATVLGPPMRTLSVIASPIVHLLTHSTEMVLRILGIHLSPESPVTEEEIKVLIEQGTQAGMIEEAEQDMLERVFRLGDRRVSAIMTPRTKVVWLNIDDPPETNQALIMESVYSRFPVYQGNRDNILGVVHVKDLLVSSMSCQPLDLQSVAQRAQFVPESMRALRVLELFKQSGSPIALVIDEYGHIQGLVTLNDVLEAIVGDIPTMDELVEPQAIQREDGSWLLDGMLPVDEFKDIFAITRLPGEADEEFQTLGGFVMMSVERIPMAGDYFEWGGYRFEVMDMDGNRVDKVLVMPLPQE